MTAEFVLRFGVSLIMIVFGMHQFLKPRNWLEYLPKWLEDLIPLKPETDLRIHALGNIIFGILFLIIPSSVVMGWIVLIWWLTILPFAFRKNWAIGMRDLTIIFSIIAYLHLLNA
jgi:uncharacterized membrane protein